MATATTATTAPLPVCRACDRPTPLHCSSCHHTPFCSTVCHTVLAATHPWVCSQPADSFTFPPLTATEKRQLDTAYESNNVQLKDVWTKSAEVMHEHGWDWAQFPALFTQLALGTSGIAEPGRSVLLSELHWVLLNARNFKAAPVTTLSPWTYTALTARWILDGMRNPQNAGTFPSYAAASLGDIVPLLHRLLVYWTVSSPTLTGFTKASIKRTQKLALERLEATAPLELALGTVEEKKRVGAYPRKVVELFVKKKV